MENHLIVFIILKIFLACIIEHDTLTTGGTSTGDKIVVYDRFCPTVVEIDSRVLVHVRALATAECILTRCLQVNELRGTVFARSIFVRHSRLHYLLQALALARKLSERIILLLQGLLEIRNHPLLNLLKVLDAHLVGLTHTSCFTSALIVLLRHLLVVSLSVKARVSTRLHFFRQAEVTGLLTLIEMFELHLSLVTQNLMSGEF